MDTSSPFLTPHQITRPNHYGNRRSVVVNWSELVPGDTVLLLRTGESEARISGEVDVVSPDGSLLWLLQDDCGGRRMFLQADDHKTLLDPKITGSSTQAPRPR